MCAPCPSRYVLPGMISKVELEQLENTVALVTILYKQDRLHAANISILGMVKPMSTGRNPEGMMR